MPLNIAYSGGHYEGPDLSGQKITISGPWLAPQDDQFRKVIKAFTDATGATVEYGGSDSFEQQITIEFITCSLIPLCNISKTNRL